jgi:hypothetical protein
VSNTAWIVVGAIVIALIAVIGWIEVEGNRLEAETARACVESGGDWSVKWNRGVCSRVKP